MKCENKCGLMAIEERTKITIVWNYVMAITKHLCRACAREWDAKEKEAKAV